MGNSFLLLDNISVLPISCTNFDERDNNSQEICPRFDEDFKNDFYSRWNVIDPFENKDGPSNWKRLYDVEDREIILAQTSNIHGISDMDDGSIFLLNSSTKVCSQGKFSVKFKALGNGIVGLVFRYNDKGDFYILEIAGEIDKFMRIRKRITNVYRIISMKPLIGFNINQWYNLVLYMNEDKFNVYIDEKRELLYVDEEQLDRIYIWLNDSSQEKA